MQLVRAHKNVPLLSMLYLLIIRQHYACDQVVEVISFRLGMNIKSPLVLTFAGLSGQGKTELATQIGKLLEAPITVIDCAQMRSDISIFGSHLGYAGKQAGSQLDNFLAANDGSRSVVFLDELDKTEREVRNSLLLLLDSGEYHDRRSNTPINAKKIIWILATNLGDTQMSEFYANHLEDCDELAQTKAPHKELCARSLSSAVDEVRRAFFTEFADTEVEVEERQNAGPLARYVVRLPPVGKDAKEVVVVRHGETEFHRGLEDGSAMEMEMMESMVRTSLGDGEDDEDVEPLGYRAFQHASWPSYWHLCTFHSCSMRRSISRPASEHKAA